MTEGITGTLFGEELAIRVVAAFRNHDGAETVLLDVFIHLGKEFLLIEFHFREQDDHRNAMIFHQAARSCDPASMTTHHLDDEHLGGGLGHGA